MKRNVIGMLGLLAGGAAMYAGIEAITARAAGTPSQIDHQGVVLVNGARYTGTGSFRFAIVDPDSGLNRWTNDGSNVGGSDSPTAAVSLQVTDGIYSVRLGDTNMANMSSALPANIFEDDNLQLRIWFDDGAHGSQQLSPDHALTSSPYCLAIADGIVSGVKLATGAVGTTQLADGAVTTAKLAGDVAVVPVGTVVQTILSTAPAGWLLCDGSAVSRTTYAALFAGIGTTYGAGDGSSTFNLPDFRGRIPLGVGIGAGGGTSGNGKPSGGSGLSARNRGDWGGAETHTLTIAEMPSHSHGTSSGDGFANSPGSVKFALASNAGCNNTTCNTSSVGGNAPHNNVQPFTAVNFMVKY